MNFFQKQYVFHFVRSPRRSRFSATGLNVFAKIFSSLSRRKNNNYTERILSQRMRRKKHDFFLRKKRYLQVFIFFDARFKYDRLLRLCRSRATEKLQYITFIGRERQPYGRYACLLYSKTVFKGVAVQPLRRRSCTMIRAFLRPPVPCLRDFIFSFDSASTVSTIADIGFSTENC